jgi:hypothetical protein
MSTEKQTSNIIWLSHNFFFKEDYCEFFLLSTIEKRLPNFHISEVSVSAELYGLNYDNTVGRRSVSDPDPDHDP